MCLSFSSVSAKPAKVAPNRKVLMVCSVSVAQGEAVHITASLQWKAGEFYIPVFKNAWWLPKSKLKCGKWMKMDHLYRWFTDLPVENGDFPHLCWLTGWQFWLTHETPLLNCLLLGHDHPKINKTYQSWPKFSRRKVAWLPLVGDVLNKYLIIKISYPLII